MLGEGDGRFLALFTQCKHLTEIDYVDASPAMLELARRRVAGLGNSCGEHVRFFRLDARHDPMPNPPYDVIVTHFFLDCITEEYLAEMVPRIRASSASGARWIISEFRKPARGIVKYVAYCLLRTLYIFFRITTGLEAAALPSYRPILQANGFVMESEHISMMGLLASELWVRKDAQTGINHR